MYYSITKIISFLISRPSVSLLPTFLLQLLAVATDGILLVNTDNSTRSSSLGRLLDPQLWLPSRSLAICMIHSHQIMLGW